ncbi:MAG: hypothetical protein AAGK14_10340 [Verrucomicrobiota bacterium]
MSVRSKSTRKAPANGAPAARKAKPKSSPVLTPKTQKVFGQLEKCLGIPFVAYWTSTGGSICQNDVMAMSRLLENVQGSKLGLFVKSDGGNPEAALRMIHLLRHRFRHLTLFAPFECASAATMIALGANEIHMGPTSYLTAVDTSFKHQLSPLDSGNDLVSVSQDEVMRILKLWHVEKQRDNPYPELYKYLHPLVIGALDRSSSLSIRICKELLGYHLRDTRKANRISKDLNSSYPSHSYPITAREAKRLGLNVKPLEGEVNDLLLELNGLYSNMAQPLLTDYDEENYHNNEICNILELPGRQIFYQIEKDWHYRREERRWVSLNDKSRWKSLTPRGRGWQAETIFIR